MPITSVSNPIRTKSVRHKRDRVRSQLIERAERLLETEIAFIANPGYRDASVDHQSELALVRRVESGVEAPEKKASPGLPAHLARLCAVSLLSPEEESECFRRMNYCKHRANSLRAKLSRDDPDPESVREIEQLLTRAKRLRDHLIRSNTRLVMSIARKYTTAKVTFDDLLSHGLSSLLHVIEKFDYARGYRFSTYATCAIRRDLYRLVSSSHKDSQRFLTGAETALTEPAVESHSDSMTPSQWRRLTGSLDKMLAGLDERERVIISMRFDLEDRGDRYSYSRLGRKLGISKERVRQLANRAIGKLREMADEHKLEALLA